MRKWHRWIGLPAGIFLLVTAFTGVWLECERFFGEEEALREKVRDLASKHTAKAPAFAIEEKLSAARSAVAVKFPDAPLDKISCSSRATNPPRRFFSAARTVARSW